jgi:tripartite-type tricarboxylate transporter receptor subunit TctC
MAYAYLERTALLKSGVLAAVFVAALAGAAVADPVSDFYAKNRVTIAVGGTSQGGYAVYARTIAQFLPDYIPGHPTIVVQYMPGAGSIRAANYIYNIAKKDGSEIGAFEMPILTMPLYESGSVQYDSEKFYWLGSLNSDVAVCYVRADSGITTLDQAMQQEVIIGATAPSSNTASYPTVLNSLLKTQFSLVVGYNGPDLLMAMWRNEVQGQCGSWGVLKGLRGDLLKTKAVNLLVQLGTERDPDLPDVPLVMDFVKSEEQKATLAFIFGPQKLGRPYALPPEVPMERVTALRKAFSDVAKDPRLIAAFEKQSLGFSFVDGVRMQGMMSELYRTPKAVVDMAMKAGAVTDVGSKH